MNLTAVVIAVASAAGLVGMALQAASRVTKNAKQPIVRVSKGRFAPEKYAEIKRLIDESAAPLVPAIERLAGLLYYHAAVDASTNTVVNISTWESEQAAKQMDTLAPMLAQRPILEAAGVQFDKIANYEAAWKIEGPWAFPK
jgi:quinol monooxygenase YgiN